MSDLLAAFRKEMGGKNAKNLAQEAIWMPSYPTGIDVLDYRNGRYDENGDLKIGLDGGKIVTIIGRSGAGKTSLAIKVAGNIADQFEESQVIHLDPERATDTARILSLTGWTEAKMHRKYIHMNKNISTETVYGTLKAFAKLKMDKRAELEYDTGRKDFHGKPIMALPPTIFILDSLAVLRPRDMDEKEDLATSMAASAVAKANTSLYNGIMAPIMDANIIFIAINHIRDKINTSIVPTQAQVNYLKQDETLPGGHAPIYLSNYIIKVVTGKKLDPTKELGIQGFENKFVLVKSRSAAAGLECKSIYAQQTGYSNTYSNFVLLKDCGKIGGAGRSFYLENAPDIKFSQKDFEEKVNSNEELNKAYQELVKECLAEFVPKAGFLEPEEEVIELDEKKLKYNEEYGVFEDKQGTLYEKISDGKFIVVTIEESAEEE